MGGTKQSENPKSFEEMAEAQEVKEQTIKQQIATQLTAISKFMDAAANLNPNVAYLRDTVGISVSNIEQLLLKLKDE